MCHTNNKITEQRCDNARTRSRFDQDFPFRKKKNSLAGIAGINLSPFGKNVVGTEWPELVAAYREMLIAINAQKRREQFEHRMKTKTGRQKTLVTGEGSEASREVSGDTKCRDDVSGH